MSDETVVASQSDEVPVEIEKDPVIEALFAQFDIKPKTAKKDIQFPDANAKKVDPAIDQTTEEVPAEAKKSVKVKYNKEEIEVDEAAIPEWVEKGMNLDKVRSQKTELEKNLERAAKLEGLSLPDYIASLDKKEQQQQQKKIDEMDKLKSDMKQEFIDNGLDPEKVDAFIENHPLMQKAREAIAKDAERSQQDAQDRTKTETNKVWQDLYTAYPDLVESSDAFNEGKEPEWFNADMKARILRGYDPKDAYELAHRDKLQTVTKKQAEQSAIKAQQLGNRAAATNGSAQVPDEPTLLPQQIALAQEFGVNVAGVMRHQKILDSRRK